MKTPKRTPWQWTTQPCLTENGELRATICQQAARWKRKNRTRQLKRTIAKKQQELEDCDRSRIFARRALGGTRNLLLEVSRETVDPEARKNWLKQVGAINLFLALTTSKAELDREFAGEEIQPKLLDLTDEEREIIRQEFGPKDQETENTPEEQ